MVYQIGNMTLEVIQEISDGIVNDVVICRDRAAISVTYYTVLVIKNHDTAKRLLEIYESGGERFRKAYVGGFTWRDQYLMVFDYKAERPVDKFFFSEVRTLSECEQLCLNIIIECMSAGIPYPVLYLMIAQKQVHIRRDGGIYFGYCLDLASLSVQKTERDCATLCAKLLFLLLDRVSSARTVSYRLLNMKNERDGYQRFVDLYKDIAATAVPIEKEKRTGRIKAFYMRNRDRLYRVLLVFCLCTAAIALIMLLSQMIFSDIPLFRLFVNSFEKIGTESLLN